LQGWEREGQSPSHLFSLWGAGAVSPPQRPTRGYFSGACGPQAPTERDVATALLGRQALTPTPAAMDTGMPLQPQSETYQEDAFTTIWTEKSVELTKDAEFGRMRYVFPKETSTNKDRKRWVWPNCSLLLHCSLTSLQVFVASPPISSTPYSIAGWSCVMSLVCDMLGIGAICRARTGSPDFAHGLKDRCSETIKPTCRHFLARR